MSASQEVRDAAVATTDGAQAAAHDRLPAFLDPARKHLRVRRRGWLVRRVLLLADVVGLALAFLIAEIAFPSDPGDPVSAPVEYGLFLITLPGWVIVAKLYGLYDRDEERTDHTTTDDIVGVFHVVTVGAWLLFAAAWVTHLADPNLAKLITFWFAAIAFIAVGRTLGRAYCRQSTAYLQNAVVVGAGDVGRLVARKLRRHPEYGVNVVGFCDTGVDETEIRRHPELVGLGLIGSPEKLPELVRKFDIERVIIAFAHEPDDAMLAVVRSLKHLGVQIDIVPRFFQIVGPNVGVYAIEGLPVVGLPPARLSRSSHLLKRTVDVTGALIGLALTWPIFLVAAILIKRDSPGPVFFRQQRLGYKMKEFTALKFRTMRADASDDAHREYIKTSMDVRAALPDANGLYKLQRDGDVTRAGRWLRKTSLDELPQLINVLKGEMSLVGPRPCIPYEIENFAPHHFERFQVLPGLTGLWQVTARAHSTFAEALDMDVAYARAWSLKLDLWLLCRTPLQIIRQQRGTA